MYSNHLAVHLEASKEIILEEYKKKYELKEVPRACVTRPLAASKSATPTSDHPAPSKNFGERTQRLLNEIAVTAASTNNTTMSVVERPDETEPPQQPGTFVDTAF